LKLFFEINYEIFTKDVSYRVFLCTFDCSSTGIFLWFLFIAYIPMASYTTTDEFDPCSFVRRWLFDAWFTCHPWMARRNISFNNTLDAVFSHRTLFRAKCGCLLPIATVLSVPAIHQDNTPRQGPVIIGHFSTFRDNNCEKYWFKHNNKNIESFYFFTFQKDQKYELHAFIMKVASSITSSFVIMITLTAMLSTLFLP
jgi:hypothetical protein